MSKKFQCLKNKYLKISTSRLWRANKSNAIALYVSKKYPPQEKYE